MNATNLVPSAVGQNNVQNVKSAISTTPWLLIGISTVLLVGGLVFFFIVQKESHPWYTKRISWMNYLFGTPDTEYSISTYVQDTTSPLLKKQTSDMPVKPSETWCFVGEDNTGRWCVKVPLPSLCEPIRTYGSRNSCEMTLAQQLPSGIVTKGGQSTKPLASLSLAR